MRAPRWVNVVLEGGGFELEEALARYRGLRRLLVERWEPNAARIVTACRQIAARAEAVEAARAKAIRRVAQDPQAVPVRALEEAVAQEAGSLVATLDSRFPLALTKPGLVGKLVAAQEVATEEAYLDRGWRRFLLERKVITGTTVGLGAGIPLVSWLTASDFGSIPTLLDGHLFDTPLTLFPLIGSGLWVLAASLRAATWQWLGFKPRSSRAAFFGALGVFGGAMVADSPTPVAVGLGLLGGISVAAAQLLWTLWRAPSGRPGDVC